ncbi:MAG: lipopolysaccharide biosynthesis protein [Caldimonas sp.]|uniref:lipopolysaccharide biosynthesis protein n=1 Tax=Caldimonas sp. TaxID=2838790 RepID=UPI003919F70C
MPTSLTRSALGHFLSRLAAVGLGLVLLGLAARGGPAEQGVFSLLVATEAVYAALFSGFGLVVARQVSHHREAAARWLGGALGLALGAGGVGALAFWAAGGALADAPAYRYLPALALAAPWLLLTPTVSGLYLGLGRMGPINALTVAPPALALLALGAGALVGQALTLWTVVIAWLGARVLVGLAGAAWAWHDQRGQAPDWPAWRAQAGFCAMLGLTNLISWLNYRIDLFIVEAYGGLSATGVYAIAVTVTELLWFISSSVSAAAYGRIGQPDREAAARLTVRLVHFNLGVLLVASPVLLGLAAWALPRVLGEPYADTVPLMLWLLPGVWAYGCASTLSAYYTNFLGKPRLSAAVAGVSLLINVGACLLLVPRLGATGAAIATSLSYGLAIAWGLALFRRHAGLRWRDLLRPSR